MSLKFLEVSFSSGMKIRAKDRDFRVKCVVCKLETVSVERSIWKKINIGDNAI